jgi:hypothetical protein
LRLLRLLLLLLLLLLLRRRRRPVCSAVHHFSTVLGTVKQCLLNAVREPPMGRNNRAPGV